MVTSSTRANESTHRPIAAQEDAMRVLRVKLSTVACFTSVRRVCVVDLWCFFDVE